MAFSLSKLVPKAQQETPWDLSNRVLYGLCRKHPEHNTREEVVAKVLMIGRVYAAAIERRRSKTEGSDDFYTATVAPLIIRSKLDDWIARAAPLRLDHNEALDTMVDVHGRTTGLFQRISGLEKRSLASKYLHFHVPRLFVIYDTRAASGLRAVSRIVGRGRADTRTSKSDDAYYRFASKCLSLRQHVKTEHGASLTPRQLDNLLLLLHESR